jgi:hypothetical protein
VTQRQNRLTTRFSERIPVVKGGISVCVCVCVCVCIYMSVPFVTLFDGLLRCRMTNASIPLYRDPVSETIKANVYREVRYEDPNGDVKTS